MKILKELRQNINKMCRYSKCLTYASLILSAAMVMLGFAMQYSGIAGLETLISDAAYEAPRILFCGFILAFFADILLKNGRED